MSGTLNICTQFGDRSGQLKFGLHSYDHLSKNTMGFCSFGTLADELSRSTDYSKN